MMKTEMMEVDDAALERAASLLRAGALVAFPTETVYGLGADAYNEQAVRSIFEAKGRPADNPLIVHIADLAMLPEIAAEVPAQAQALMDAFWPGPLTLILPRAARVPAVVSAGLDTVAVRMPSHPAALALLRAVQRPIAAPSANRSGRPSPTSAEHVLEDMDGRIPLILDGGVSGYGVESTVLDLTGDTPVVLRPGGVTVEMLRPYLPEVAVDPAVLAPLAQGADARSPGMRHRHYAPNARVVLVTGEETAVAARIQAAYEAAEAAGQLAAVLCPTAHVGRYAQRNTIALGKDAGEMARNLYDALRRADALAVDLLLAEATDTEGMGLALMNRLLRAADFDVIKAP